MDKEIIFKNRKDYEQRIGDYTGEIECHEEKMKEFYKKEFIKYEKIFSKLDCHLEYSFSEWKSKKWQYLHVSDVFCEVYYKAPLYNFTNDIPVGQPAVLWHSPTM